MPKLVEVKTGDIVKEIDMTVDTGILADGDLMADVQEITNAFKYKGGVAVAQTVTVLDKDDQGGDLYVVLLNADQSLGSENDPPNISDANAEKIIAVIPVGSGDYVDFGGCKIACIDAGSRLIQADNDTHSLWIALLSADTKTYAGGVMHIKLGLAQ